MKIIRFIRNNILIFVMGIIVGSITVVIAANTFLSSAVEYDTTNSNSAYNTVQGALDDLYNKVPINAGLQLATSAIPGVSTSLVAGLYRYQGTTNINNYICFGTRNPGTCTGNTDQYMYRIIGITEAGEMKLIKMSSIGTKQMHSTGKAGTVTEWPNTTLYKQLNGLDPTTNEFLGTAYVPNGWEDRIAEVDWHNAINISGISSLSAESMASAELGAPTVKAKIGLMYFHDYYYGLEGGHNCANSNEREACISSWISLPSNGGSSSEWSFFHSSSTYWYPIFYSSSVSSHLGQSDFLDVRPVFYLNAYQVIGSGTGKIDDPYILDREYNITNNNNQIAVRNTAPAGVTVELMSNTAGLYVGSFKVNGATITGNTFTMPQRDVEITDVIIYNITNNSNNNNVTVANSAVPGSTVKVDLIDKLVNNVISTVASFKMNGTTIIGNTFTMPASDVEITDVVVEVNQNYMLLDYLQFTGTQYIDTMIIPSNHTTEIEANFASASYLIGTSSDYKYYSFGTNSTYYRWGTNNARVNSSSKTWTSGNHTIVYNGENNSVVVDNTVFGSGSTIVGTQNLWIGRCGSSYFNGNIYYVKITDKLTGNLIRYFVPAVRNSDGAAGLYDLVNDVFLADAAGGNFTVPS